MEVYEYDDQVFRLDDDDEINDLLEKLVAFYGVPEYSDRVIEAFQHFKGTVLPSMIPEYAFDDVVEFKEVQEVGLG